MSTHSNIIKIKGIDNTIKIFKNVHVLKKYAKRYHCIAENEYNLISNLVHPNLVKALAFNNDPDSTSIIYEYINGGDLFDYLENHKFLKNDTIKNVIKDIHAALKYLHDNFILHQDVKLENVLIENSTVQTFKLCDFNKSINIETPTFKIPQGTNINIPPEALSHFNYKTRMQLSFTQDIWGFGILIYEIAFKLLTKNCIQVDLVIPTHDDPLINNVLQNCLKQDPLERNFGIN